jgi:uncharacterized protein
MKKVSLIMRLLNGRLFRIVLLLAFLFFRPQGITCADIPFLTGRVNDYANILSDSANSMLSGQLKEHEDRTTNQVVVLTIQTLDGESIEDFANKVFNDWGLGQKGKDNGILIVVVPDDRSMRIEVGYGLEGTLPDVYASRIINNIMAPAFREGDYDGGVTRGAGAVMAILDGAGIDETAGAAEQTSSSDSSGLGDIAPDLPITTRILLGAFIFGIIGLFTVLGIITPGAGWFLYIFLIPFWAMFPIMVVGTKGALVLLIAYLVIFPAAKLFLKRTPWYKKAVKDMRTKGKATIGGFALSSGGSGGSWSSGGGSSFSGGGGSSGGGGASGSW